MNIVSLIQDQGRTNAFWTNRIVGNQGEKHFSEQNIFPSLLRWRTAGKGGSGRQWRSCQWQAKGRCRSIAPALRQSRPERRQPARAVPTRCRVCQAAPLPAARCLPRCQKGEHGSARSSSRPPARNKRLVPARLPPCAPATVRLGRGRQARSGRRDHRAAPRECQAQNPRPVGQGRCRQEHLLRPGLRWVTRAATRARAHISERCSQKCAFGHVQLAMALAGMDKQVGLLDIDICGPSQPTMMGVEGESVHQSSLGWSPVYPNPLPSTLNPQPQPHLRNVIP